jgi:MoxR-like ATPase
MLADGETVPYSGTTTVRLDGGVIALRDLQGNVLARFDGAKPQARMDHLTPATVPAVNAFLRPFGKVKSNWRAEEGTNPYRWHPRNGAAITPAPAAPAPVQPAAPVPAPVAAPVIPQPAAPVAQGTQRETLADIPTVEMPPAKHGWKKVGANYLKSGKIIMTRAVASAFDTVRAVRLTGEPAGALITGPAGTAKTLGFRAWCHANGLPYLRVEAQGVSTADEWYGGLVQDEDGKWVWRWSPMARAIMTGEPVGILLDELNRCENERAANGLLAFMDDGATVWPARAPHPLRLHSKVVMATTLNEGIEYTGTIEVDGAVRDRFGYGAQVDYPPTTVETQVLMTRCAGLDKDTATRMVRIGQRQRELKDDASLFPSGRVLSTRVLVAAGLAVLHNSLTPADAIRMVAAGRFMAEDMPHLNVLIEAQFGASPQPVEDEDDDILEAMLAADD